MARAAYLAGIAPFNRYNGQFRGRRWREGISTLWGALLVINTMKRYWLSALVLLNIVFTLAAMASSDELANSLIDSGFVIESTANIQTGYMITGRVGGDLTLIQIYYEMFSSLKESKDGFRHYRATVAVGEQESSPFVIGDETLWVVNDGSWRLAVRAGTKIFQIQSSKKLNTEEINKLALAINGVGPHAPGKL